MSMSMNTQTNNKRQVAGILVASAMILGSAVAQAQMQTISLNWSQYTNAVNNPVEPYGVEPASNWNNVLEVTSFNNLTLGSGTASTVDLNVASVGSGVMTYVGSGVTTLDYTPLRGGLRLQYASNSRTLNFSDLSGTFTSTYDIIVYITGYNANANGNVAIATLGATTYYCKVSNPFTASLIQSTDTVNDGVTQAGTYVRFSGLSGDSQSIVVSRPTTGGEVGIGGFQIVGAAAVPEPSSAVTLLLGAGVFAGIRRRRLA
jgi:hypothetical protein